jgi:uncharacterized protein
LYRSLTAWGRLCTVPGHKWNNEKGGSLKALDFVTALLLVVGGLNWGLVAIAEFDLVATLVGEEFGETNALSRIVYGLVGLSAVYQATRIPSLASRGGQQPRTAPSGS